MDDELANGNQPKLNGGGVSAAGPATRAAYNRGNPVSRAPEEQPVRKRRKSLPKNRPTEELQAVSIANSLPVIGKRNFLSIVWVSLCRHALVPSTVISMSEKRLVRI